MAPKWFYKRDANEEGPVSSSELKQMAVNRTIQPTTLIRRDNMSKWVEAASVKGLFIGGSSPTPDVAATVKESGPLSFQSWYAKTAVARLPKPIQAMIWAIYGFIWIPVLYASNRFGHRNFRQKSVKGLLIACAVVLFAFVCLGMLIPIIDPVGWKNVQAGKRRDGTMRTLNQRESNGPVGALGVKLDRPLSSLQNSAYQQVLGAIEPLNSTSIVTVSQASAYVPQVADTFRSRDLYSLFTTDEVLAFADRQSSDDQTTWKSSVVCRVVNESEAFGEGASFTATFHKRDTTYQRAYYELIKTVEFRADTGKQRWSIANVRWPLRPSKDFELVVSPDMHNLSQISLVEMRSRSGMRVTDLIPKERRVYDPETKAYRSEEYLQNSYRQTTNQQCLFSISFDTSVD